MREKGVTNVEYGMIRNALHGPGVDLEGLCAQDFVKDTKEISKISICRLCPSSDSVLCPSSRKQHILNLGSICQEPFISKRKRYILNKWLIPCLGRRDKLTCDQLRTRSNVDEQAQ